MKKIIYDVRIGNDYFGELKQFIDLSDVITHINDHPHYWIRVDSKENRVLLKPEVNGRRVVEGLRSLAITYEWFNDVSRHAMCSLTVGDDGHPGGFYNVSKKCFEV